MVIDSVAKVRRERVPYDPESNLVEVVAHRDWLEFQGHLIR
jgi:hypothetical protein